MQIQHMDEEFAKGMEQIKKKRMENENERDIEFERKKWVSITHIYLIIDNSYWT